MKLLDNWMSGSLYLYFFCLFFGSFPSASLSYSDGLFLFYPVFYYPFDAYLFSNERQRGWVQMGRKVRGNWKELRYGKLIRIYCIKKIHFQQKKKCQGCAYVFEACCWGMLAAQKTLPTTKGEAMCPVLWWTDSQDYLRTPWAVTDHCSLLLP